MVESWIYKRKNLVSHARRNTARGIISPLLANMTLDSLEARLKNHFGRLGSRKRLRSGVNLIRYADDFIITGRT